MCSAHCVRLTCQTAHLSVELTSSICVGRLSLDLMPYLKAVDAFTWHSHPHSLSPQQSSNMSTVQHLCNDPQRQCPVHALYNFALFLAAIQAVLLLLMKGISSAEMVEVTTKAEAHPAVPLHIVAPWFEVLQWLGDARWRKLGASAPVEQVQQLLDCLQGHVALLWTSAPSTPGRQEQGISQSLCASVHKLGRMWSLRACVRACVFVCMRVHACVRACVCVCVCVCVFSGLQLACTTCRLLGPFGRLACT